MATVETNSELDRERLKMENRLPMMEYIQRIPWSIIIIVCLTLGLAPFTPPHIVEKIHMLSQGKLVRPIDWFDLFIHGVPWLLLIAKVFITLALGRRA